MSFFVHFQYSISNSINSQSLFSIFCVFVRALLSEIPSAPTNTAGLLSLNCFLSACVRMNCVLISPSLPHEQQLQTEIKIFVGPFWVSRQNAPESSTNFTLIHTLILD
eukprot:GABV01003646.1.p1 GENE.GABV01003646.1~~GABV01003646.1.p1  ORF type:complete len:108 (+),score=10.29 GABV01003646.1:116-439(+)